MADPRSITIEIPGEPVAMARARVRFGQGGYTPRKQREWMQDAAMVARIEMGRRKLLDGCLNIHLEVRRSIPQSWPKWKRAEALNRKLRPAGPPDLSNFLKIVEDALNQVVWVDDAQIVNATVVKVYSENPGITLSVDEDRALTPHAKRFASHQHAPSKHC